MDLVHLKPETVKPEDQMGLLVVLELAIWWRLFVLFGLSLASIWQFSDQSNCLVIHILDMPALAPRKV